MIERTLTALLAGLLLASSVRGPRQDDRPERATPEAVTEALDAGDYERAHGLVTELLLMQRLERAAAELRTRGPEAAWKVLQTALALAPRSPDALALQTELAGPLLLRWTGEARALLQQGNPRDAMVILDGAVALAPADPEVGFLRGECALRMGIEDGDVFAFDDAERSFLEAAGSGAVPEAWSGAARASFQRYFNGFRREDLDRALEFARRGREESPEDSARASLMLYPPLRTWAEVSFQAYVVGKQGEEDPARVAERFEGARTAFEALIGRAPEDPWAWRQLANLYLWESRPADARAAVLRALDMAPEDAALHEKLVEAARAQGGSDEVLAAYREWTALHPEVALGHWWLGAESLDRAITDLLAGTRDLEGRFDAAEAELIRCRELAPDFAESCNGSAAICRAGTGWCRYYQGDLEGASDAFLSMEDCLPGGLQWQVPGRISSGVEALRDFVIVGYMERATDEQAASAERNRALERAAEIGTRLHRYLPDDPDLANNSGFLNRDAGVALQQEAEMLLRRSLGLASAGGGLSEDVRAGARAEAERLLARAREHMEASYSSYVDAAALAPEDARVLNDTGLILTYYLQRELDAAERYLRRAIEVGNARLEAGIEDESEREAVTEAVGDAHQNLGVLLLTLQGDPKPAGDWFRRSIEIGPFPRPQVEHVYLPLCDKVLTGAVDVGTVKRANYWNGLDPERVVERIHADDELRRILYPEGD